MSQALILVAVFTSVLIVSFAIINIVSGRREVARNLESATAAPKRGKRLTGEELDRFLGSGNENIRYYFEVVQNEDPNSLRMRLVQAGFVNKNAVARFNLVRFAVAALTFLVIQLGVPRVFDWVSTPVIFLLAMLVAGFAFVMCSFFLERMGKKKTIEYRKLFPDFMDLLLVCVDAGLSIEAAIDRVTREFMHTNPDFGLQLSIISLEIRAGRRLHEALNHFAERIGVEEAKSLAVLFRQSEELGSSVSKTLRVFSAEMRTMRIIRAEEKANSLPIKMLFPMALFMFPVSLIIVLVPILMSIIEMLIQMAPA